MNKIETKPEYIKYEEYEALRKAYDELLVYVKEHYITTKEADIMLKQMQLAMELKIEKLEKKIRLFELLKSKGLMKLQELDSFMTEKEEFKS